MKLTIILFLILSLTSCSSVPVSEPVTQADINLTEPMYEILGMLKEYMSRYFYPGVIETFSIRETNEVNRMETLLKAHANITGIGQDWEKEFDSHSHVTFVSNQWSDVINSFYVINEDGAAILDSNIFCNATETEMVRFINGAFARYGYDDKRNVINMANGFYKIQTIGDVLEKLGCTNIMLYRTHDGMIPVAWEVAFTPSSLLQQNLGIQKIWTEKELSNRKDWLLYKKLN